MSHFGIASGDSSDGGATGNCGSTTLALGASGMAGAVGSVAGSEAGAIGSEAKGKFTTGIELGGAVGSGKPAARPAMAWPAGATQPLVPQLAPACPTGPVQRFPTQGKFATLGSHL